jgi:hypothetical protein
MCICILIFKYPSDICERQSQMEEMKTRKDKLLNMTVQARVMKETVTEDGNKLLYQAI